MKANFLEKPLTYSVYLVLCNTITNVLTSFIASPPFLAHPVFKLVLFFAYPAALGFIYTLFCTMRFTTRWIEKSYAWSLLIMLPIIVLFYFIIQGPASIYPELSKISLPIFLLIAIPLLAIFYFVFLLLTMIGNRVALALFKK